MTKNGEYEYDTYPHMDIIKSETGINIFTLTQARRLFCEYLVHWGETNLEPNISGSTIKELLMDLEALDFENWFINKYPSWPIYPDR